MVEETICLQCGDRGYENAFVYCIRCLNFAVHRYCLDKIPETFDEFVSWLCDDCNVKVRKKSAVNFENFSKNGKKNNGPVLVESNEHVAKDASGQTRDTYENFDLVECGEQQSAVFAHDATPCQTKRPEVSENIESFSENGKTDNGPVLVEANEHIYKDALGQTLDACEKFDLVECGEKSAVFEHDATPCQTKGHEISENIENFSENGRKNDPLLVEANEHVCKDASGKTHDAYEKFDLVECGEQSALFEHDAAPCQTTRHEVSDIESFSENGKKNGIMLVEANGRISKDASGQTRADCATFDLVEYISAFFKHDAMPCQTTHSFSKNGKNKDLVLVEANEHVRKDASGRTRDACAKFDLVECGVSSSQHIPVELDGKTDEDAILLPVDVSKISQQSSSLHQLEVEKAEGNLVGSTEKNVTNKDRRNIVESTAEKDQHGLAKTCIEECVEVDINECTGLASDSTLASKVRENECCEQKDGENEKIKNMKSRKRKRMREGNIVESIAEKDQHGLAAACYEERVKLDINKRRRLASDSTLASKVKENECSEKKDENMKSRKREGNIVESIAEKDQHGLATACYEERVKVDINECIRLASDSTLASKKKENDCSEQKNGEKKKIKNRKSRKRKRMRERDIVESTAEKDQHGLATACYEERVKADMNKCTTLASDSILASKEREKECSGRIDGDKKRIKNRKRRMRKKMRERNCVESTAGKDQHGLATACYEERVKADINECTGFASDSTLASKVRENECSEQKHGEKKKIKNRKSWMRKKMRERNFVDSPAQKGQHGLATASYEERVNVDISKCTRSTSDSTLPSKLKENECSEQPRLATVVSYVGRVKLGIEKCARSASDSTLPSKVKENECSKQKDQTCISKPFDSNTDLGITVVPAGHPVISSDGPSNSAKQKKTSTSSETISQRQPDRTGGAQPLHTDKPLYVQNELADLSTQEKDLSSNDPIGNKGPEDKEEQTSTSGQSRNTFEYYPQNLGLSVALPIAMPIWRGNFNIWNKKSGNIDELMAHISNKACYKVYEAASQLQPVLGLEMLPKSDIWPNSFRRAEPNGDNIALYFFPDKISEQVFEQLVDEMIQKELALKALMQNAELLIFTSTELPLRYWRFHNKYYLWGVFKGKQANPLSSEGEGAEIPLIRKRRDDRSPISPLSNSLL